MSGSSPRGRALAGDSPSRTWLLLALLPFVCIACAGGSSTDAPSAGPPQRAAPVRVRVTTVARKDVPVQLRAVGSVEPVATVTLRAQVEGTVAAVHFNEGQAVTTGALLFDIDPRPFDAALRQAQAQLAKDRAERDNADVELQRRATLLEHGFVSRNEYDQAFTHATATRAAVQGDEAAVETARLNLQYCSIRAPIDGRIGRILAHVGNAVKRNETPLAIVNQIRPVDVAFAVPERELPAIRARATTGPVSVTATVAGATSQPPVGELTFIDNSVDTRTGTVLLKARFPNADETLWPGQFVDVTLTLSTLAGAAVVPSEAVQTGQQGPYVYIVTTDQTAEVRPLTLGYSSGAEMVVERGASPGEVVVTEGQIRLTAGAKVDSSGPAGAGAAAATPTADAPAR